MNKHNRFLDKNILIVDDSKTIVLLLKSMLEDEGYTSVHSTLSAQDAYTILDKEKIDLILLDVIMPEIGGIEACKAIRDMPNHKNTPIIMVTGEDSDEVLKQSFDAGADDFTTKPINFTNLNTRIKSVLSDKEKDQLILSQTRYAAMNEIISTLSDHWKEPLAAIRKSALDLDNSYKSNTLTKQIMEKNLVLIEEYTKELSKTIDEFKNISEVENHAKETNINKLVRYALSIIQSRLQKSNIKIQLKEQTGMKKIMLYPNALVRALLNIFINTQEAFSKQNKNTKKVLQVVTSQDDMYTSISIKDNAGGIKEEYISQIFNPYFSTKKDKTVKGLGLHYCKQVIEEHIGGKIQIFSKNNITEILIQLEIPKKTDLEEYDEEVKNDEIECGDIQEINMSDEVDFFEKESEKEKSELYNDLTKLEKESKDNKEGIQMESRVDDVTKIEKLDVEKENSK